jgi:hypothetical protein
MNFADLCLYRNFLFVYFEIETKINQGEKQRTHLLFPVKPNNYC